MKQSRFTEEQIILALRQQESREKTVAEISREMGVSQATFFKWKQKYGGMSVNEARRLLELEPENARLKRMLANVTALNKAIAITKAKAAGLHIDNTAVQYGPDEAIDLFFPGRNKEKLMKEAKELAKTLGCAVRPHDLRRAYAKMLSDLPNFAAARGYSETVAPGS